MKRILIGIASLLMFVVVATAQASYTSARVSPLDSPVVHSLERTEQAPMVAPIVNPWAFLWIRWSR